MIARPLSDLRKVMAVWRGATILEESKCHPGIQRGQEGDPRELRTNWSHLNP